MIASTAVGRTDRRQPSDDPTAEAVVLRLQPQEVYCCTAPGMKPRRGTPVASYVAGLRPTPAF